MLKKNIRLGYLTLALALSSVSVASADSYSNDNRTSNMNDNRNSNMNDNRTSNMNDNRTSNMQMQDSDSREDRPSDFPQDRYKTSADEQLNKTIRDKVSKGWLWDSYKEVSLNTSDGVVTLEGTVDSVNDQKKLTNEIQKIDGVKSVKSDLTIKNK